MTSTKSSTNASANTNATTSTNASTKTIMKANSPKTPPQSHEQARVQEPQAREQSHMQAPHPQAQAPHPQAQAPQARVQVKHPYLSLMGLYLGGFCGMYSETALNIALPQLSQAFGVELSLIQWLVVGYMLAIGIVLPFSSLLMKWFSARKITLFALGAFLIGSLISTFSFTFGVCLAGRIIQGVGTGLLLPMMFSMVMEVIPPHKIGAAMGINALVIMSASAIGPTLAGILIGAFSWHYIFASFAIILICGIFFTLKWQVNPYELSKPHIDFASVVTSCLGFGGIVFGVGVASLFGWASLPCIGGLVVGFLALIFYAYRQLHMETPVLDLQVFKTRGFLFGTICVMLNFGVILGAMFILPQFYQNTLLLAVSLTGIVMLPGGVVNALSSMFSGRIYDKIGARTPALLGFLFSLIAIAMLMFANENSALAYIIACHVVLMIGVSLAMSPCQTYALASLPHHLSTDGSAVINTLQQVMGAVCTALVTFLVSSTSSAFLSQNTNTTQAIAFSQGAHVGFLFVAILACIGFVFALQIKKQTQSAQALQGEGTHAGRAGTAAQPQAQAELSLETTGKTAASAALQQKEEAGAGIHISNLMKTDVYVLQETDSTLDALRLFASKKISGAPVVNEAGKVVGFISDGDIIGTLAKQTPKFSSFYAYTIEGDSDSFNEKSDALAQMSVAQLATRNVISVNTSDDMRSVCATLALHHLKKAPVMENGKMVGIINRSDITRYTVSLY